MLPDLPRDSLEVVVVSTKRVLIIDDEVPVRVVVRSCFEDVAGWEVLEASSAQEGLRKAVVEQPDAIVLDVMMPEMDGITLVRCLRANPATQPIPVVLLTAKVDLVHNCRYPTNGIVGAIAKPFDPIRLVDQVAGFLGWVLDEYSPETEL